MRSPYDIWRDKARRFLAAGVPPQHADWHERSLLLQEVPASEPGAVAVVPAALVDLLERAACHRDPAKNAFMYRLLWRVVHDGRALLHDPADDDVMLVTRLAKAVNHASHKMKAFVRFRELHTEDGVCYVARFEPEHDVLMRTAPFFAERFACMCWAIATPDGIAHWDRKRLSFVDPDEALDVPSEDAAEALWLTYYASIFNPARLNVAMMCKEMPIAYWRNLPEAARIPALIAEAMPRAGQMIEHTVACGNITAKPPPPRLPSSLQACRRCALWERATQPVPGTGPDNARIMIVGEQPGDEEDLVGKPFVGPAGRLLRRACEAAELDPGAMYVTNAVKHFSYEPRGKRRIHKTPAQREIEACGVWLDDEIGHVKPHIIVTLGATALFAVMQRRLSVGTSRGTVLTHPSGARVIATYHPSAALRAANERATSAIFDALVQDLRSACELARMRTPQPT